MNRLSGASSPYLRQHANNPVDWWPWISDAFQEAKRRNVPVHLSVGYAACHWCHVMARESFSDPETAALLNGDFVSIKVDREERPEIDQIYMRALHALGEQGGWPLTMFLTPDAEPFWGGTYFPPEPRWGRPSFRQVLQGVSAAWRSGDASVTQNVAALRAYLERPAPSPPGRPEPEALDAAAETILSVWDRDRGSFKGAPKFPNAAVLDVLWRAYMRTANQHYRSAVLTTLHFLCQGGIYDHLGGGFSRYAVDAAWKVPHFEKMLYDNALILSLLALAYRDTRGPLFGARIGETIGWLVREMQLPGGAFASSLDADTHHEEGLTYTWTWPALSAILGDDLREFASLYDASPGGNWEGKIILNRLPADSLPWLGDETERRLAQLRHRLLEHRASRPQPARDDKVLADWNGLAISGLVQAARASGSEVALLAARQAFHFVAESMIDADRIAHSCMDGVMVGPGLATDYANMIRAALDLFAIDGEDAYLNQAQRWFRSVDEHHFDAESAAYCLAADDAPALIAKPLSTSDEATPAAGGVMSINAANLFMLTGDPLYRTRADQLVTRLSGGGVHDVVGSASLQSGYDTLLRGRTAFVVGPDDARRLLLDAALSEPDPALFIAGADPAVLSPTHPAAAKRPTQSTAALFLCDSSRCLPEVSDAADVAALLKEMRPGLA